MTALKAGISAPQFSLSSAPNQRMTLSDLLGRPVVLVFYPADWSPVCGDQLALYNELREEFAKHDAALLGISVDGAWCHAAFAKDRRYHFPLLADFEPKGEVARLYGVYRDTDGFAERALFVLDQKAVIRWSYVSPVGVNPGADGILSALEALSGAAAPGAAS
jgi:peroxiredoxin